MTRILSAFLFAFSLLSLPAMANETEETVSCFRVLLSKGIPYCSRALPATNGLLLGGIVKAGHFFTNDASVFSTVVNKGNEQECMKFAVQAQSTFICDDRDEQ